MSASPKHFYEFGPFRIDAVKRLLLCDGESVPLKSKCFETLLALVEARGQVLEKDELMRRIWPDSIVEESNLTVYISTIRKALNESPQEHRYIVTVPGRGYSFVAEITEVREAGAELIALERNGERVALEKETASISEQESATQATGSPSRITESRHRRLPIIVAGTLLLGLAVTTYYWRRTETVKSEVAEEQQHYAQHGTKIPEAARLYMNGRYFWNKRDAEGMRKAVDCFRQALDLDPSYAQAWAGLADAYAFLGSAYFDGQPPSVDMPRAKAAALRAIELDKTLAEAHCALAFVLGWYEWNWPGSERELKVAMELDPKYATARQRYAWYLLAMGRLGQALAEMKEAQKLDPLSQIITTNIGTVLYYQREYDQALAQFRQVANLDSRFRQNHVWPGWAFAAMGLYPEAIAEFQQETIPWEQSKWGLGYVYALTGKKDEAREILRNLQELSSQRYISPSAFILIHTALEEKQEAFLWLDKAIEERDFDVCLLKVDPKLDGLRTDPRFSGLLQRVGLTP